MLDAINEAIYNKLNGTSAVTSLLSSATAIFVEVAPQGAVLPYIIITPAGGGSDNDTPTDSADVLYYIKGVAETALTAGAVAEAIYNALHESTPTIDSPWSIYRCQHVNLISYTEPVDRKVFRHMGGSYRIRISQ